MQWRDLPGTKDNRPVTCRPKIRLPVRKKKNQRTPFQSTGLRQSKSERGHDNHARIGTNTYSVQIRGKVSASLTPGQHHVTQKRRMTNFEHTGRNQKKKLMHAWEPAQDEGTGERRAYTVIQELFECHDSQPSKALAAVRSLTKISLNFMILHMAPEPFECGSVATCFSPQEILVFQRIEQRFFVQPHLFRTAQEQCLSFA